jgi:hypothetical protein
VTANIKCPQLVEWSDRVILICNKGDSTYVPDLSDLQSYCKTNTYNKCHYFVKPDNFTQTVKNLNEDMGKT